MPTAETLNYTGNITAYLQHIGECSHFVAARFHAVIIAVKYGIPVIPVIYSSKTVNLLDDLGYRGTKINLENIQQIEQESFAVFPKAVVHELVSNAKII
ncbi:polysaccharide pyruvyl transferase family protein [Kaistella anthropi]|nr:polysaccharide pyruvyl transferase family protein [Kaistella anthropi]